MIPGPIDCDNDSDRCVSKLLRTRAVGAVTPSFAASVSDPSGVGTRDRTRPDESGRPSYVTAEGYRRLEEEAHRLWTVDRPRMAKAVEIAAAAFRYGGAGALFPPNILERLLRDIQAASQHIFVSDVNYETHGKHLLGLADA